MASKITIGTAPDSWGVWFASDPEQLPAEQFLREVVEAGYEAIELGPYGYLPNDPAELQDALDAHGLTVLAGNEKLVPPAELPPERSLFLDFLQSLYGAGRT